MTAMDSMMALSIDRFHFMVSNVNMCFVRTFALHSIDSSPRCLTPNLLLYSSEAIRVRINLAIAINADRHLPHIASRSIVGSMGLCALMIDPYRERLVVPFLVTAGSLRTEIPF